MQQQEYLAVIEQTIIHNTKKNQYMEGECSICMNMFKGCDKVVKTSCSHFFHHRCLNEWLADNDTCPLCREYIDASLFMCKYSNTEIKARLSRLLEDDKNIFNDYPHLSKLVAIYVDDLDRK